jgi:hypothetical protein
LRAAEEGGAGDEEEGQNEPSYKDHSPEEAFLLFDDEERAAGEEEAWGGAGDSMNDGSDSDVGLRLPGNGVGGVGAEIVEDARRWCGECLVQVPGAGDGCALIVVEDGEG